MTGLPMIFGDGVLDVHVANGVARITFAASAPAREGQQGEGKPVASGVLMLPVVQLPVVARVLGEVTRQVEERARAAMQQAAQRQPAAEPAEPAAPEPTGGAFRFNG